MRILKKGSTYIELIAKGNKEAVSQIIIVLKKKLLKEEMQRTHNSPQFLDN